jgi:hypothetical protein
MERNAHRLTLHSPAREILPRMGGRFIDFAQTLPGFRPMDGDEKRLFTAIYYDVTTM